jgi:2-dehydro-3-deoxy-D-arabinonate dehydratase
MRLFKTFKGIAVEKENSYYLIKDNLDSFINDDNLVTKVTSLVNSLVPGYPAMIEELLPPIGSQQKLWACGVTYLRSKISREDHFRLPLMYVLLRSEQTQ